MNDPRPTPAQLAALEYLAAVPSDAPAPTMAEVGRALGVSSTVAHDAVSALWSLGYLSRLGGPGVGRQGGAVYRVEPGATDRARAVGARRARAKPGHASDEEVLAAVAEMVEDGRYPSKEAIAARIGKGRQTVGRVRDRLRAEGRWPARAIAAAGLDRYTESRARIVRLSVMGRKRRKGETPRTRARKAV